MPSKIQIYLVRHGQSEANVNPNLGKTKADHKIELTEEGKRQAEEAGKFLYKHLKETLPISKTNKIRVWNSPYTRTRQTSQIIFDEVSKLNNIVRTGLRPWTRAEDFSYNQFLVDKKEHFLLHEQQFGIFDGLSDEERAQQYPDIWEHYEKNKKAGGKVWAKHPIGESRIQVAQRIHQAFGTFHRDSEKHEIDNLIIVGHGTTNRAFTMAWLHLPPEWFETEPNPLNCSVRMLHNGEDKKYIFPGFKGGFHKGQ